ADTSLTGIVARWLGAVFGVPAAELATAMQRFTEVVELRPASLEGLAAVYALQTRLKHSGAQPDAGAIAALIARAERISSSDRDRFLATCAAHVGAMLAETLPT